MSIPRKSALLSIPLAFLGAARFANAQTPTKIRVSLLPLLDTAPFFTAMKLGYFAAEGLDVDTFSTTGGAVGLPALLGGDVQIVFTNSVSTLQAVSKGIPLTIIAQANETNGKPPNTAAVISSAAAPLTSGRDLDGKRFAVNTLGNIIWLYARHWIEQTGGHPDKVQFIELPFPSMSDALKRREIDAAFISQPFLSAALADSSIRLIGWPYSVDRRPVENSQYVTTQTFAASNSETIRHFVRALNRGVDWVNHNLNSQAFAELVSGYSKIPIADIQKIVLPPYQKVVHADALHRVMDLAHSNGLIDRPIDIPSILYVTATTPP